MFKKLTIFRFQADASFTLDAFEDLDRAAFIATGPTQPSSIGFVPPRGNDGEHLVENIGGELLLRVQAETRPIPPQTLKRRVEELAAHIEEQTGRKPGKKALRDLKEQATLELLPQAFPRRAASWVWISPRLGMVAVEAGGRAAEEIVSLLIKTLDGLAMHMIQTAETPTACMAAWLMDGLPPAGFTIDRECELKSEDEMKSVVRYGRHALDIEEVKKHLTAGKRPTRLALTYKDRVSFELTDTLQVRKISFLDVVLEGASKPARDEQFDADAVIATTELGAMLPALIEAMGGEHDFLAAGQALAEAT